MYTYIMSILLCISFTIHAQQCNQTLSGTVIDVHDGTALEGAILKITENGQQITTTSEGAFVCTDLCAQQYTIEVSHHDCTTRIYRVRIDGATQKTFRLEHHLEELNEILIQGAGDEESRTLQQKEVTTTTLEEYSSGSLGDALQSISGVSSLNTGNAVVKPMINGLHSSRVVIMNNGVRMEDQEWGAEHAPTIDINSATHVNVIKGAGALQYSGDAIGGVIVADGGRVPIKDSLYGKTLITGATNGRGGTLTSQLTKSYENGWYGVVQGTLKHFGDVEAPDYVLSNTGVRERNLSLRFGFNQFNYGIEGYYSFFSNKIGILRASHLGGAQDQVRAIASDRPLVVRDFTYAIDPPRQEVIHHLARIKGFKELQGGGKIKAQYDFQQNNRLEFDIRRGEDRGEASLDLQLQTHTLRVDVENSPSATVQFKAGVLGSFQNNFADPDTGVRRLIPDYDSYGAGAYGIAVYPHTDALTFELGARFDYTFIDAQKFYRTSFWESRNYDEQFPELVVDRLNNQILANPKLNFYNPSATAGFTYSFGTGYQLFANYALSSRAPNPSELFSEGLHHSAARIELGALDFTSEVSHKIAVTLERNQNTFSFSVQPYFHAISDFILIEPTGIQQSVRGNFQIWEYRQTNAQLLGVDIDASYAFAKNFRFDHRFSLVKGYDKTRDEPLIQMPPAQTTNTLVYQNPKWKNLRLQLESTYVFRQNEFPDDNFEVFIPQTESTEIVDVSTPPDAYHVLNFHSSMDWKLYKQTKLTVGFKIQNLGNTTYRNYLNRLRFYGDDLGRNFLLQLKLNY